MCPYAGLPAETTALAYRCLLSSGSRVRILPGALVRALLVSFLGWRGAKKGAIRVRLGFMTHAISTRRGYGEDSIYWDASKNRFVGL